MIFGSYLCCGGSLAIPMPQRVPAYLQEDCPHCGVKVWHRLSRVQSTSRTEVEFLAEHDVDEAAKSIAPKAGTEAARFTEMNRKLGRKVEAGEISLEQAVDEAMAAGLR